MGSLFELNTVYYFLILAKSLLFGEEFVNCFVQDSFLCGLIFAIFVFEGLVDQLQAFLTIFAGGYKIKVFLGREEKAEEAGYQKATLCVK